MIHVEIPVNLLPHTMLLIIALANNLVHSLIGTKSAAICLHYLVQ